MRNKHCFLVAAFYIALAGTHPLPAASEPGKEEQASSAAANTKSKAGDENAGHALRAGIIGLDTSHVVAFTKLLNQSPGSSELSGVRVVAAFPGGSKDIESSASRLDGFTKQVREMGVEIVDSIPTLLTKVDVVLLESVDGRPHLEQVRPVFAAGKPVFIDKPLAGTLTDCVAIVRLGRSSGTPWFCSSSLRFAPGVEKTKHDPKLGELVGAITWSPCKLEEHHPDLYWYGVHGCEMLYAYMGTGCQTVTRVQTEGTDEVTGVWNGGRIGTFRGLRDGKNDYGAVVFGTKAILAGPGSDGYEPLVKEIVKFFKTRQPPVSAEETLELMTFMEAADESKRQHGKPVSLHDVLAKAEKDSSPRP